jgi:uncharacterized protein involved in outer membrane biogenesis
MRTGYPIADRLKPLANRHRTKLWVSGVVIVLYTLLGFFLVPWLVEKLVVDAVRERFDAELSIDKVAFNPYVLGLRIEGLAMQDPEGRPFVGAKQIYVNLQLSSLFRFAPTFKIIQLDSPEAHLRRGADGALNLAFLAQPSSTEPATQSESVDTAPPRLVVHEFAVNEAALYWRDAVPPEPVETTLGPVNIAVLNLNTLPQREGQQDVVIKTETSGTLGWTGTLQLNPLRSVGRAELLGSHMELVSAYIRHTSGFDLVRGYADVGFDYVVDTTDGELIAEIDNFEFALSDVLVRTFGAVTADGTPDDRDVLAVPAFNIRGGTLRWPEQSVSVNEVAITDAELSIYRDAAGVVNLAPRGGDEDAATALEQPGLSGSDDWNVSLGRLAIESLAVDLTDDSLQPRAELGIDDFTLAIEDIKTSADARFPTEISIVTRTGGTVTASGEIGILPATVAELSLRVEGLSLAESHPYLKPLADVNLDSGQLNVEANISSGPDDVLAFSGNVSINDFMITETDEGSRLGSWNRLALEQVALSLANRKLAVSEVRFEKPYADVFIAEDGSVNLGRIEPGQQQSAEVVEEQPETEQENGEPSSDAPFDITIGRIVVADAAADFADFSLPLPFEAGIAALNGEMSTVATASAQPSEVLMEGKVDEFGLLRVSGTITPLDVARNTDIKLRFQNVEIPKFSAYTIAFAGREIASGKLDLDLGYAVTGGELVGENRVVLRDFELGDRVEHPGAMSLPLGLAVALLKGPDGTIDIDLPVRGDVNDPEFGYGRVIGRALANLIVKIAASPFLLLGNLIGVEPDELDHVSFIAGRSDLTPPEQERMIRIAEALGLRPELLLEISGVVDREADGLALRTARLDDLVDARIEAAPLADASDAMYAEQRAAVIQALYAESGAAEDGTLDELRARFTLQTTDPESGRVTSSFDALAYTAELRRQLIDRQNVTEEEFVALARSRVDVVREALVATNPALADRIQAGSLQAVEAEDDGSVRMDVTLKAGS